LDVGTQTLANANYLQTVKCHHYTAQITPLYSIVTY